MKVFRGVPERHFHQAGVMHFADEGKDLGAGASGTARFCEPGRAFGDDGRNVVPGFDVIDVRGLAPESFLRGEGWAGAGPAGLAFQ